MQVVSYIQSTELCVWVLISDSFLEGSHSLLGGYSLGSDDVGDFEVQGNVLSGVWLTQSVQIRR